MTREASELADEPAYGLIANAHARPDALALVCGDQTRTYADLDDRARRVAVLLQGLGIGAGDRIAVLISNSTEWFEVVHGVGRLGAVVVPVNVHFKSAEAGHVIADSGASAVVVASDLTPATAAVPEVPRMVVDQSWDERLAGVDDTAHVEPGGPGADGWPTTMAYTSGTTGKPKGVAIGRDDFRRRADGIALMAAPFEIGPGDVHLLVGPTYHAGPAVWAQVHLAVGATVVVMPEWGAADFLGLVERHGVTTTHVVPANFIRLLDLPESVRARHGLSSLRLVWHAAAPCPVSVKRAIMDWFPDESVYEYYGASEGGGTSITPGEWLDRPGSVGKPYPGNEFKVTDDDGRELAGGETGVLWVRTQFSSFEYHEDPAKTSRTYDADGFFSVGDMGYLDDDGYLFITDRKADMVISGGVNVYPREVEETLYDHPAIADCAVFGIPDDKWGEALLAVIQPAEGAELDAESVVSWCRRHLADFKRPRHVELVAELPRDPNGKVMKRALRERVLDDLSALG